MNVFRTIRALRAAALVGISFAATQAGAAIEVVSPEVWTLYRGPSIVQPRVPYPTKTACEAAAPLDVQHRCLAAETFVRRADAPPPGCTTPQPATETRTVQCPAGTTGSWSQSVGYTAAPYPTCWAAGEWTPGTAPAGTCTPIVTPPPPAGTPPLLGTLLNFAETASRNWNHGGHAVTAAFTSNYGFWDYTETTSEPWLFDRPDGWRKLCELTSEQRWCTQAASDLAWYQDRIGADGVFTPKGYGDTKYSYVHPWSQRADNAAIAKRVYDATLRDWPDRANLSGLWTERELWVALSAAIGYHSVSGDPAALARGQAMLDQWDEVSAGRGAPLVTYTLHEGGGPGGTQPQDLVSSPWMSALYFQAAREYVAKVPGAAAQVNRQASDYFDWLNTPANRGFYSGTEAHAQYAGFWFPSYIAGGTTIGEAGPDSGNMDHALDIAGFIAFAIKAKQAMGLPTEAAQQRLADMKATAARNFENWTRTTDYLPKYRMTPPRKWNWWLHGYYELRVNGGE